MATTKSAAAKAKEAEAAEAAKKAEEAAKAAEAAAQNQEGPTPVVEPTVENGLKRDANKSDDEVDDELARAKAEIEEKPKGRFTVAVGCSVVSGNMVYGPGDSLDHLDLSSTSMAKLVKKRTVIDNK